jgi:hypothetical protein
MGMLFRNSDLEVRFALNMNVLIDGRHAQGLLAEGGAARLPRPPARGPAAPLAAPAGEDRPPARGAGRLHHRLPHLDRVIDIIRYDEDPKAALMREDWSAPSSARRPKGLRHAARRARGSSPRCRPTRSSTCACAPAPLEEMELRREFDALTKERADLEDLLAPTTAAVDPHLRGDPRGTKKVFGKDRPRRRPPHPVRRGRRGGRGPDRGDDRARTRHRRLLPHGLDPGDEGPPPLDGPTSSSRTATARASPSTPRRPTRSCSSARTAASTRSRPPTCPAGAAWANPCA